MGKTTVDIDALIAENALEIVLGGKTYTIVDVPMKVFLEATNVLEIEGEEGTAVHRQVALLLGVELEEIENVGFRAATVILDQIRKWMVPEDSEEEKESSDP